MKIDLNIFTNSTKSAPSTAIIERTYKSFRDTFGDLPVRVWIDKNPNVLQAGRYYQNLKKIFPQLQIVKSLSDGYVKAIKASDADYIFMLEHDWQFKRELIKHSLNEIATVMSEHEIYHLRFNKRENIKSGWEKNTDLQERKILPVQFRCEFCYCLTNILSNNPHLINRKYYVDNLMSRIKIMAGSKGIECQLSTGDLCGAIYGGLGYPATLIHQDGRRGR